MDKNTKRLVWISFFSYGLTGALVIVTGVLLDSIATYFHVPVSYMSNTFTFLNSGILVSICMNFWLMEIISIKRQLIFGFILNLLAINILINSNNLFGFSLSMFILGYISGITMSIGTYLITSLYDGRKRGSYLLFADSFFSMSGIIFPIIAGYILSKNICWYWIYIIISLLYVAILILTLISKFPMCRTVQKNILNYNILTNNVKEKWGIGVFILSSCALFYILGQLSFIAWVPEYASTNFNMNIKQTSSLVSNFWIAYMIGMWVFTPILRYFDLQKIVTILSALSTLFMYFFIQDNNSETLCYFLICLGFISSAIYTTLITLGSQQTRITSPKLVNFILICGTIGTMLTFIVTSPIVRYFGVKAALQTANIMYALVFLLCAVLGYFTKHRDYNRIDKQ